MGKIEAGTQCLTDRCVLTRLLAIVRGDRMGRASQRSHQMDNGSAHIISCTALHMRYQRVHGPVLGQLEQGLLMVLANYRADLPIVDTNFAINNGRPLIDGDRIHHLATAIGAAVALVILALATQMLVEIAA